MIIGIEFIIPVQTIFINNLDYCGEYGPGTDAVEGKEKNLYLDSHQIQFHYLGHHNWQQLKDLLHT